MAATGMHTSKPVLLVVGVGAATGAAVCRRMASTHRILMVARSVGVIDALAAELPDAYAFACDVGVTNEWQAALELIVARFGVPDHILVNTEGGGWGDYHEIELKRFAASFPVNVVAVLALVQTLFPARAQIAKPARIVISSSPAAYGSEPRFLGLAPARAAQRVLVETLDAVLCAVDVRFCVLSIAGAIDEPNMRRAFPTAEDSFFIRPQAIAECIVGLLGADELPTQAQITAQDGG